MKHFTKREIEGIRGELFHMILFSMAWALIGEYALRFKDYAAGVAVILIVVVWLALFSIRLYDLEEDLPASPMPGEGGEVRRDRLYAIILVFEGMAVLVTWTLLLNWGYDNRLIPCFAGIAGLHFFPLARVIRQRSYYFLGIWVCFLAVAGYFLLSSGKMSDYNANALVAYGCAAGSVIDGLIMMAKASSFLREKKR